MTGTDYPWEPPLAGTEAEHLVGALDRLRATFRWKADGLDAAGLRVRIGASSLTLGGLLKHLAAQERANRSDATGSAQDPIRQGWEGRESTEAARQTSQAWLVKKQTGGSQARPDTAYIFGS